MEYASEADRLVLGGLRSAGEAWIVGGWVREAASGRRETDMDIATTLLPAKVKELFPRSLRVGEKYGTVIVRLDEGVSDGTWEVTTIRCRPVVRISRFHRGDRGSIPRMGN